MIQQTLTLKSNPEIEREIRTEIAYKKYLLSAVMLKLMTLQRGKFHADIANEKINKFRKSLQA